MGKTSIEWTCGDDGAAGETWNPVTGCTKVSPGCDHCYAEGIARRFAGSKAFPNGFDVTLHPQRLDAPLRWRKPRRVFVNSMSDLFHDDVPDEFIARVWAVMAATPQHTYQVLTKRHGRMRSLLSSTDFDVAVAEAWCRLGARAGALDDDHTPTYPLRNVWVGASVENQRWADIRIPALLDTPAAVRFLSCEPLLGPVDLRPFMVFDELDLSIVLPGLHWVICGGESGAGARPIDPEWARSLVQQCRDTGVAPFVKQLGSIWASANGWGGKGALPEQWPADLRVREFPAVTS